MATNHVVNSLERQAVVEDMLESTKPRLREETGQLHFGRGIHDFPLAVFQVADKLPWPA